MKQQILNLLTETEEKHQIKIHYACESGSRAWGFPSPDSDYDFRFIYQHKRDWYLSVNEKTDNLKVMPEPLLDGNGWDIRKVLRLMYKSNVSIYEWLNSPIIYRQDTKFVQNLKSLSAQYFLPNAVMRHYLGIATGMIQREMKGEQVKIKKYFYVLRPILAAYWVGKKEEPAPMEFSRLLELVNDENALTAINNLLKAKETAKEGELVNKNMVLDNFIEKTMTECEVLVKELPKKKNDYEAINDFYRMILGF